MKEVTRYLFRWYDPLREKWIKSRIRLTEEELKEYHKDGYEILWGSAEKLLLPETQDEANAYNCGLIKFDRRF